MNHRIPNPNKTRYTPHDEPLPIRNLNRHTPTSVQLRHHLEFKSPRWLSYFDEEGWLRHNAEVRQQRDQIFKDSIFRSPVELYKRYPLYATKQQFTYHEQEEGNMLVQIDECNLAWADDIAQLTMLCGVPLCEKELRQKILQVQPQYEELLEHDMAAFAPNKRALDLIPNIPTEPYRIRVDSTPVEVYDRDWHLLYICPCLDAVNDMFGIKYGNAYAYLYQQFAVQGEFHLRGYYDNDYAIEDKCLYDQVENGKVVNSFITIDEAIAALDISDREFWRYMNLGKKDRFGCSWQKHKQQNWKIVEDCPPELRRQWELRNEQQATKQPNN